MILASKLIHLLHYATVKTIILTTLMMIVLATCACSSVSSKGSPSDQQKSEVNSSVPEKTQESTAKLKETPKEVAKETPNKQHDVQASKKVQSFRKGSDKPNKFLQQFFDLVLKSKAKSSTLKRAKNALTTVLKNPKKYRFQLLITEVDVKTGKLTPHEYRVDHEYLYPASAVKTFASLASLMYFTELRKKDYWISIYSSLNFSAKMCTLTDQSNIKGGYVTLLHEIRKTQLVSSNKAFNRVFNVVGSEKLHDFLGPHFPSLRVYHRLSSNETHQESLRVPALMVCHSKEVKKGKKIKKRFKKVLRKKKTILSDQNAPKKAKEDDVYTGFADQPDSLHVGKGYIHFKTKRSMKKPMDFTWKNRVSLYDFQLLNAGIYDPAKKYNLFGRSFTLKDLPYIEPRWLNELRKAMVEYPRQSDNPVYTSRSLSETRFKPLMRGLRLSDRKTKASGEGKGLLSDQNLYYLNKAGKALGFHVDNAFIAIGKKKLTPHKKTFRLHSKAIKSALYITVGVYVNDDQVLNDNKYEYTKISVPLLDAIGYAAGLYLQDPTRIKHE